ncbi:MAG: hypothetical protein GQ569_11905 [Methylococcaceae bacterium]|nr:hypothetical protein [Methylococcaceae bacterium]
MKTPDEIRKLAYLRLEEADILCQAGKYDGAFYLAGYSIELMLKAKICKHFQVDDLFDGKNCKISGIGEIKKAVQTHDISALLVFSGLHLELDDVKASDEGEILDKTITKLFQGNKKCIWNEQVRYSLNFQISTDVQELIRLLYHEDGLLHWIEKWI